ncbi:organic hydroperoxide resistance protein [Sphingomonas sp. CJ20]
MSTLYSTRVTAVGGRSGSVRSEDGILALDLALPAGLGGKGGKTNPEQLFAAGYAACFENAVLHVAKGKKVAIPDDAVTVVAEVGISPNASGGFALSVSLDTTITGVEQAVAEELVHAAHAVCPYSNAVKGNIDVALTIKAA